MGHNDLVSEFDKTKARGHLAHHETNRAHDGRRTSEGSKCRDEDTDSEAGAQDE